MMYLKICTGSMVLATMMGSAYAAAEAEDTSTACGAPFQGWKPATKWTWGVKKWNNHDQMQLRRAGNALKLVWRRKNKDGKGRREVVIVGNNRIAEDTKLLTNTTKFYLMTDGNNPEFPRGIVLMVPRDTAPHVSTVIDAYFEEMFSLSRINPGRQFVLDNLQVNVARGFGSTPELLTVVLTQALAQVYKPRTKVDDIMPKIVIGLRRLIASLTAQVGDSEVYWREFGASFRLNTNHFNVQTINRMRMFGHLKDELEGDAREHTWMYEAYFSGSEVAEDYEEADEKQDCRRITVTTPTLGLVATVSEDGSIAGIRTPTGTRLHRELVRTASQATIASTSTAPSVMGFEVAVDNAPEPEDVREARERAMTTATMYSAGPSAAV